MHTQQNTYICGAQLPVPLLGRYLRESCVCVCVCLRCWCEIQSTHSAVVQRPISKAQIAQPEDSVRDVEHKYWFVTYAIVGFGIFAPVDPLLLSIFTRVGSHSE